MKRSCAPVLLIIVFTLSFSSPGSGQELKNTREPSQVVVRGRVVCLDQEGRSFASEQDCKTAPHRFGLDTSDQRSFRFLPADTATAIFEDSRMRGRELQLAARLHPENQLEIIKVYAVNAGKLYDIYYYCEVCNITSYAPGLCPCCRREMELREVAVN